MKLPITFAIAVAAVAANAFSAATGESRAPDSHSLGSSVVAWAIVAQDVDDFETNVLQLLSAGRQSAAERLIRAELARYPAAAQLVELVGRRQDGEANALVFGHQTELRSAQRPLFYEAACMRSRFDKRTAFKIFDTVWTIDRDSPAGQCAYCMLWLDSAQIKRGPKAEIDRALRQLKELADANADDPVIRWMLAVQCRTWDRNEQGAEAYKQLLKHWKPGPALVHQTYANLLDELSRFDQALPERYLAVRMEPAGWSFNGLGNTLKRLARYDEASAAYWIATRMKPRSSVYWSNWAEALNGQGKYDQAIAKCQRALKLSALNWRAHWMWGQALDGQGKTAEALAKCQGAAWLYPRCDELNAFVATLKAKLRQ